MSTLETNAIGKYSGNNVSIDDALNLKSYTTAQRDALTSVAGDTIYNSDDNKVQVYTGSAWEDLGGINAIQVDYVIIGGGAGGTGTAGNYGAGSGAGAGGYLASYNSESSGGGDSSLSTLTLLADGTTTYRVSIGAGGSAGAVSNGSAATGGLGSPSEFVLQAVGGGAGGTFNSRSLPGASGGGGGSGNTTIGQGIDKQGFDGGLGKAYTASAAASSGGGGGAGSVGEDADTDGSGHGGDGGAGVSSTITGSSVERAGGGGGGVATAPGSASGGGGAGGLNAIGTAGTANTGGGGGASANSTNAGASGGSGVVILRYPDTYTISQTGLTLTTATDGSDKVTTITAGTGTVSWS